MWAATVKKTVNTSIHMGGLMELPAHKVNQIRDISIQLVRNAVVHGLKDAARRAALGKNAVGQIQVNLTCKVTGEWQL